MECFGRFLLLGLELTCTGLWHNPKMCTYNLHYLKQAQCGYLRCQCRSVCVGLKKKSLHYNPEPERFSLICFSIHVLIKSTPANMGNFMSSFAEKMYFVLFDITPSCDVKLVICSLERAFSKGNLVKATMGSSLWRLLSYVFPIQRNSQVMIRGRIII